MLNYDIPHYESADLSDLFEGLIKIQLQLDERLKELEKSYFEIRKKLIGNTKALDELEFECGYEIDNIGFNEDGSIYKVRKNATDAIKIINSISLSEVIQGGYIKQLKSIAGVDRKKDLEKAEDEWLKTYPTTEHISIFKQAFRIDEWIKNCLDNIKYFENFAGQKNPFIDVQTEESQLSGKFIHSEKILLKTLGIEIQGTRISCRTSKAKKVFNPTEETLIYFLYTRFLNDPSECFSLEILSKKLETSEGNLRNRITNINQIIADTLSKAVSINTQLIKNEFGRGYHFNQQLFPEVTRKSQRNRD